MSGGTPRLGDLSALKLALMAKKARAEAGAVLRADPIAIVGMGCRAPGGVDTPARFWELLRSGSAAIREVPSNRWNADDWFDPDPAAPGKTSTKRGGFLDHIDRFDAGYFGILPREADRMDPQQRLFLEVAIEALDDAGQSRERLRGSRSGVFVASYQNDYAQLEYEDPEAIDARTLTGTLHSVLANRLSYFLDLRGPSLSIDTACSSSLVAVHLACQSLRSGESDLVIAGGVSLMIRPELMVAMSKVGFMAPDGHCKTFDARADGFGRGEGCAVLVLRRLADAVADDDRVLAVIRGSAVNQDGRSTVLAAPNGLAQEALIREALANAQLDASRIGFVEAHGTGTALGDPLEVEALASTVGKPVPGAGPCLLGAAKANLGHLEAAAGAIGLVKAVLALEHDAVPPQPNFDALSPHLSLANTRLSVATALTPWPRGTRPRYAAVSAFGVGGTNAHVIVEEAPRLAAPETVPSRAGSRLLPLSAASPEALSALVGTWLSFLPETSATLDDLCHTAGERRSHHDLRVAVVGSTKEELRARLAERRESGDRRALQEKPTPAGPPRTGFVFSGQGPQWYGMGRELLAEEPVFRAVMADCDALLRPLSGWSLLEELALPEGASRLDQTEVAQPALFALQVGLAALWDSWGVAPDGVVGHSVGEIAALHVAGVLTRAEAVRIVWHRGRIMQEATGLGRMAQVTLTAEDAAEIVRPFGDRLSVGAFNGPRSVVLSGEAAALDAALETLDARGVAHRALPVKYAFHSAQMAPFQRRLDDALGPVASALPALPVYSTVTGGLATSARFDGEYLGRNVREPVRFANAIDAMASDGFDVFLEVGPHPALSTVIAECLDSHADGSLVLASLRRGRHEREKMLEACASLYERGTVPHFAALGSSGAVTTLPSYPWQRARHWLRPRPAPKKRASSGHPLLGRRVDAAGISAWVFEGGSEGGAAWLPDHRIFGRLILPGAAVLEMFFAAARSALGAVPSLNGFAMHRPLFVPEPGEGSARWQTVVAMTEPDRAEVSLYEAVPVEGSEDVEWRRIASADAALEGTSRAEPLPSGGVTEGVDANAVYARYAALGVAFGPAFRRLRDPRRGEGIAEGWIDLPIELASEAGSHALHPLMLDAGLQLCSLATSGPLEELPAAVLLPLGADRFRIFATASGSVFARARVREAGAGTLSADVTFEARNGATVTPIAVIEGMRFARAEQSTFEDAAAPFEPLYDVRWHRVLAAPATSRAPSSAAWLIFADRGGFGERLAGELRARGERSIRVFAGAEFARTSDELYVVDPGEPAHFQRLMGQGAPAGVLHLWNLDVAPLDGDAGVPVDDEDALTVGSLLHLVQALTGADASAACPFWVVSRGAMVVSGDEPAASLRPRAAGSFGLTSVVALEHPELDVRRRDLDPEAPDEALCSRLLAEVLGESVNERTAALRDEEWWAPRLARRRSVAMAVDERPRRVEQTREGAEDSVELRYHARPALRPGEVRLRILASGLNFRDVLSTLGLYPGAAVPLGVECAGDVIELGAGVTRFGVGSRVFGFAPGSLGTEVTVPSAFLARIPDTLAAEAAAGIPVAFLTAYYGLHRLACLGPGQRVLIHAAAGGVGLAAVQLAQRCGAEVFATAGSDEKRAFLRSLGVPHVMSSRTLAFAEEVRALTLGEGVDVVLNSLAGEFIPASLRVVKKAGCFLELGKREVMTEEVAARARPDVRYHLYDLGAEAQADHSLLGPMFEEILAGLAQGELRPLPIKLYPLEHAARAIRFMAQARHIGKIVLRAPAEPIASTDPLVSRDGTYWITGGLGGLGLETARWLVRSGAMSVVLSGRHAPGARAKDTIRELEQGGATVRVILADAGDRVRMQAAFDEVSATLPPLRGVIHAAGVAEDAPLLRQSWDACRRVLRGKAHGAWVLHELTRAVPLDFFVLYSAAGAFLGAPGQGPYAAANTELDALAQARRQQGLPALSVAWGLWAGVGMAAALAARGSDVWEKRGLGAITPAVGFACLERLLREGATCAAAMPIKWPRFLAQLSPGADRAFFASMEDGDGRARRVASPSPASSIVTALRALPAATRRTALVTHLTERALHVIGVDGTTAADPRVPLKELGLDSLMAVELRNSLARSLAHALPATLLFDYPTLDALAGYLSRVLVLEPETAAEPPEPERAVSGTTVGGDLTDLSDQEAEALLLKELEGGSTWRTHDA